MRLCAFLARCAAFRNASTVSSSSENVTFGIWQYYHTASSLSARVNIRLGIRQFDDGKTSRKKHRYAAAGVAHYWLVDIDARRIECLRLAAQGYTLSAEAQGTESLAVPDWPDLTVDLAALWR